MSFMMDRTQYTQLYGPTVGDSVRLDDTDLFAAVERDLTVHGQECRYGGGKVLRDGMGVSATATRDSDPMVADTIISGVLIIDYTGIYKADIGLRDGKILAIGKGGNPDNMDNVDFVVGASTEAISGEGLICTAGGIDLHVHYLSPGLSLPSRASCATCMARGAVRSRRATSRSSRSTPTIMASRRGLA